MAGATGLAKRLLQGFTGGFLAPSPDQSGESVPAGAKKWNCQKYQVVRLAKKAQCELVWSCAAFRDATDAAGHFDPPRRKTSSPGCSGQKLRRYRRRKKGRAHCGPDR